MNKLYGHYNFNEAIEEFERLTKKEKVLVFNLFSRYLDGVKLKNKNLKKYLHLAKSLFLDKPNTGVYIKISIVYEKSVLIS